MDTNYQKSISLNNIKWFLYCKKFNYFLQWGLNNGLVKYYDSDLLNNLRTVIYGGLPATILLLFAKLSNGHCYDRGKLICLGFGNDDFKVIDANIDSIRLRPDYIMQYKNGWLSENYSNHCFAERITSDGLTWVYDTSLGLVIEKKLYFKMQNPRITKVNDRKSTLEYLYEDFLKDNNSDTDKDALPLILPYIESNLEPIQPFYYEQLKKEINLLKESVNYDVLWKEFHEDMKQKMW